MKLKSFLFYIFFKINLDLHIRTYNISQYFRFEFQVLVTLLDSVQGFSTSHVWDGVQDSQHHMFEIANRILNIH